MSKNLVFDPRVFEAPDSGSASSPSMLCLIDVEGRFLKVGPECVELLGYRPQEMLGRPFIEFVLEADRAHTLDIAQTCFTGRFPQGFRNRYRRADGSTALLEWVVGSAFDDGVLFCVAWEVSAQASRERLASAQFNILRLISARRPLPEVLRALCEMVEAELPGALCSILLLDEQGRLHTGAAPSLPSEYNAWLDGIEIGPEVGSCGTAAYRRERVVVSDIASDPLWRAAKAMALHHTLAACWSEPVLSSAGEVLGTFAIYHHQPHEPGERDFMLLELASRLSAVALERARDRARLEASEQRFRSLFEFNPDPVFSFDAEGRFLTMNAAGEKLTGVRVEDFIGRHWEMVVHEDDVVRVTRHFESALAGETQYYETRIRDLAGKVLHLEITNLPVVVNGERCGVFGIAKDITARKQSESGLRLMQRALEATANGVAIADARAPDMPVIYVNQAFERMTGYRADEILGRNCRFLQGSRRDAEATATIRRALAERREVHVTMPNLRKDGSLFWNDLYLAPIFEADGSLSHYVGVQNDISERKGYEEELSHSASHDVLTGLPNRALFEDRLRQACLMVRRTQTRLAVLFIDLDGFKPINDTCGHETGDRLLVEAARRMHAQLRPGDTVARMGGDEFVVLLIDVESEHDVENVVGRLSEAIAQPYSLGVGLLRVTASIGATLSDGHVDNPMQLVQQADMAMYQAKQAGRNTWQWYCGEFVRDVDTRLGLRQALQQAIEEDAFDLHYQPQIDGVSGKVVGFEALLRWRHPERGMVPPDEYIPLAEESGLIVALGTKVIDRACRDAAVVAATLPEFLTISVNVSALQLIRGGFVETLGAALQRYALAAERIELEITETALIQQSANVTSTLAELRTLGVRLAIDDFGTGFASLAYLKRLPVNTLKIDRHFVHDILDDQHDAAVSRAIISLCEELGLRVVAEGVETEAQFDYLSRNGCQRFQGYFFARPMPLESAIRFSEAANAVAG